MKLLGEHWPIKKVPERTEKKNEERSVKQKESQKIFLYLLQFEKKLFEEFNWNVILIKKMNFP